LSNGARAGLTGFVAGIARKTVINNVTINALLPGPFNTDRLRGAVAKAEAERRGVTIEAMLAERAKLNPAGRFGEPDEFGEACAFLCSAKAGFITGQNILLDGGAYPGTL
jgi:3-oxoacyl-[acyl-carrier protein] reductase